MAPRSKVSPSPKKLFLACFELDEPGTPTHRATFQLVAHATTPAGNDAPPGGNAADAAAGGALT